MANDFVQALTLTTLAMTLALLVVLAITAPLRRWFGARVAYLVWWLVPLAMLAVLLPAPVREVATLTRGSMVALGMAPIQAVRLDSTAIALPDYRLWLLLLWSCGMVFAALFFHRMQRRYLRALGTVLPSGDGVFVSQTSGACPAVVGAWKPRIVLPADFETRYPSREGEMVLAHERAHLRRGDAAVNLFVVALRCAYWFNPLLHWAASRFRQDQEMACDAVVLGQFPDRRRTYAEAMLKTQLAVLGLPVGCHWQSSQSLKERILMLKQPLPGRRRLRAGILIVAMTAAACSYAAWALQSGDPARAPVMAESVMEDEYAVANLATIGDPKELGPVTAAAIAPRANGSMDVALTPFKPLQASVGSGKDRWDLLASVSDSRQTPILTWELSHAGRRVQQSMAPLQEGLPVLVQVGEDGPAATRLMVAISLPPASRTLHVPAPSNPSQSADVSVPAKMPASAEVAPSALEPTLTYSGNVNAKVANRAGGTVSDRPVEIKHAPPPAYPAGALSGHRSGKVVLIVDVDREGAVTKAQIDTSNPPTEFDAAALEAVAKWKFTPAMEQGQTVPGRVRVPVTFEANAKADGAAVGSGSGKQYVWYRDANKPPVRETFCDVMQVRQDSKTGEVSSMECGIAAATARK